MSTEPNGINPDIAKAVEAEVSRQNKWLEFAQKQVDDVRRFFAFLFSITLLCIAVGVGWAFKSISDFKNDAQSSMKLELKNITSETREAVDKQVQREFVAVKAQIQERLSKELDRPSIQRLINDEIETDLRGRVENLARSAVVPVEKSLKETQDYLTVHQLILAVQANDRMSYDKLLQIAESTDNTTIKNLVQQALSSTRERLRVVSDMYFPTKAYVALEGKSLDTLLEIVRTDRDPIKRTAALQLILTKYPEVAMQKIGPTLAHVLAKDANLEVVARVFGIIWYGFKDLSVEMLDFESASRWINTHKDQKFTR